MTNQNSFTSIPRPEHPRPDFMRDTFYNLNGCWAFAFDDENQGIAQKWYHPQHPLDKTILVPFCYQSKASGIGPTDEIHLVLWYQISFTVPAEMLGRRVLLRFGAVDYACTVYVNGQSVGGHKGGYTPFAVDITDYLLDGENDLRLRVEDYPDCTQPRGKQYWKEGLMGCRYTPCSGIWQTVYLEAVGDVWAEYIHITPNIDNGTAVVELMLNTAPATPMQCAICVSHEGEILRELTVGVQNRLNRVTVEMNSPQRYDGLLLWWPHRPSLYDVTVTLMQAGETVDRVSTYFGMRKVEVRDGKVYLNNRMLYQRLILDQGYWPDTLLTPPSDEAIWTDLQWTLDFGYNGARKHQKIEDPRYYYWADRMGVLVWGEVPSAYEFSDETVENLAHTMEEFIRRDFNHPCLIAWVPLNESWGLRHIANNPRQQETARMLYHLAKAADGTRLVSGNDGWEQMETDICGLHDYAPDGASLAFHFADRENVERHGCDAHRCYCIGHQPSGQEAFLVTEYGGIAFTNLGLQGKLSGIESWGYHGKVTDLDAFMERFESVTNAIRGIPYCEGYCYTQLTDVMQEINGLLTPQRQPKVDAARFRAVNISPDGIVAPMLLPQKKEEK